MAGAGAPSDVICNLASLAEHGEIAPNTDGGTLNPIAFINPTTVNSSGRIAFNSQVDGSPRNQGVFIGNSDGTIDAIAIGCGGLGGSGDTTSDCGDPSPIGGNFGGFFFGTGFTPDINDAGDVLFFCDVNGGSSRRGLFLYRAASQDITKVAVIGDPSRSAAPSAQLAPARSTITGRSSSSPRRSARPTATSSCGIMASSQRSLPSAIPHQVVARSPSSALRVSVSKTEPISPLGRCPILMTQSRLASAPLLAAASPTAASSFAQAVSMNGTSKFLTRPRQAGLILICRPLPLTMPARSPSSLITVRLPIPLIPVGSPGRPGVGARSSSLFLRSGRWGAMPRPCLLTQPHADNR